MTKLQEYMRSKVRKGNPFLSEPKVVADLYFQRTDVKRRVRVCVCVCVCVCVNHNPWAGSLPRVWDLL